MGRREYRLCDLGIAAFGYLRKKQRKPKRRKYCRYGDRLSVVSDDGRDRGAGSVYEFPAIEEDNYELKIVTVQPCKLDSAKTASSRFG